MPAITLKNIPTDLYEQIKRSAAINFRSINGEILHLLNKSLGIKKVDADEFLHKIKKIQSDLSLPNLTDDILEKAKNEGRP